MLGRRYEGQECSAAWALELVGERWSLLILRDAMFGNSTRFSHFQGTLGIATNILAARLEDLVATGLMERRTGPSDEHPEYVLTKKGLALKPVIIALTEWGDRWIRPGPIVYRSGPDGRRVQLQLRYVGDEPRVSVADVVAERRSGRSSKRRRERAVPA